MELENIVANTVYLKAREGRAIEIIYYPFYIDNNIIKYQYCCVHGVYDTTKLQCINFLYLPYLFFLKYFFVFFRAVVSPIALWDDNCDLTPTVHHK